MSLTLLGLSGSLRQDATNTKLIQEAARLFAPDSFVQGNLRLPLYDGDVESNDGIPPEVQALADQIAAADAIVISGPEYNKGISGVLKNALDWVSRTKGNPWLNKPVAIMSAAAGRAGGERTQTMLRSCMMPFRTRLLQGPEILIAQSGDAFDAQGRLTNERYEAGLADLMTQLKAMVA